MRSNFDFRSESKRAMSRHTLYRQGKRAEAKEHAQSVDEWLRDTTSPFARILPARHNVRVEDVVGGYVLP